MMGLLSLAAVAVIAAENTTQAFYILFANQVDSSDWPEKLCQNAGVGPQVSFASTLSLLSDIYTSIKGDECVDARKYRNGVFIASPQNLTAAHVAKIKRDVPGSSGSIMYHNLREKTLVICVVATLVVAYFDFGDIPLAYSEECPFCQSHIMGDRPGDCVNDKILAFTCGFVGCLR
jgi:hypothetical protein